MQSARWSYVPRAAGADCRALPLEKPLAAALVSAADERRAVGKIWRRLGQALPMDVVCTLFPDADGMCSSIPLSAETAKRLDALAFAAGMSTDEYLSQAVLEALARDRSARQARLGCRLSELLRDFDPAEVVAAAAKRWRNETPEP